MSYAAAPHHFGPCGGLSDVFHGFRCRCSCCHAWKRFQSSVPSLGNVPSSESESSCCYMLLCLELEQWPFGRRGLEASVKLERRRRWLGSDWCWGRGGGSSHVGELGCRVGARGPCGGVRRAATLWGWLLCTATGWGASPCTCSDVDDGGAACSTFSSSELPLPPICFRVGSGRLAVSFLSFSAAASGCWLCGAASKTMPRPVIPCTAAVEAAGGGVLAQLAVLAQCCRSSACRARWQSVRRRRARTHRRGLRGYAARSARRGRRRPPCAACPATSRSPLCGGMPSRAAKRRARPRPQRREWTP